MKKKVMEAVVREMSIDIEETERVIDKLQTKLRHSIDNKRRLEIEIDNMTEEEGSE